MVDLARYFYPADQDMTKTMDLPFEAGDALFVYVGYHRDTNPDVTCDQLRLAIEGMVPPVEKNWGPFISDVWWTPFIDFPSGVIAVRFEAKVMCVWGLSAIVATLPQLIKYKAEADRSK